MKEFWIVCKWDDYYPEAGIRNIVLVTFDEQEALQVKQDWEKKGGRWSNPENCEIFHSSELPWSDK